jgi:NDP-sugar pyrophosphorylase family protein
MSMNEFGSLWPLLGSPAELFVAGKSVGEWQKELGMTFGVRFPWDLLNLNEELLAMMKEPIVETAATVAEGGKLFVGEGTKVLPGVYVEGTVVIGKNCKIGPNCYLRGSTAIGDNCHIGQAVEVKNSIIGHGSSVGHLSYVGDSILGERVNFGAGTITSNLRHDGMNLRTAVGGELRDTGRRKFGAVVGDDVHTGIHTAIYPGRKLGPGTSTLPNETVKADKDEAS